MKNLYIFMVLAGGALYGTMSSFVKLSYANGFTAAEVSFFQAFFAAVFLWIAAAKRPSANAPRIPRGQAVPTLFAGAAIGMANYLYYQSLPFISASLAIVVLMQFTWFTLLAEKIVFGKNPSLAECCAAAVVMIGSVLASGIAERGAGEYSARGIMFALGAALSYAAYITANGHIAQTFCWRTKSALIMTASAAAIFAVNAGEITANSHFGGGFVLWSLAFAIFGTTIPTALFAAGIPKIGAGVSSILMAVELPVAVVCAHFVLGERIDAAQTLGVLVMLCAIAAMNHLRSKSRK